MAAKLIPPRPSFDDVLKVWRDPPFSAADASEMLRNIGFDLSGPRATDPPLALAARLNDIAATYAVEAYRQSLASDRQVAAAAASIARLAGEILIGAGFDPDSFTGEIIDELGAGGLWAFAAKDGHENGAVAVRTALESVHSLRRWAAALEARALSLARADSSTPSRTPDIAFAHLLANLTETYFNWSGRTPGVSVTHGTGISGGPLVRFIKGVTDHLANLGLDVSRTEDAIATAWRRLPDMDKLKF